MKEYRSSVISVKCSSSDMKKIKKLAEENNTTVSSYVYRLVFGPKTKETSKIKEAPRTEPITTDRRVTEENTSFPVEKITSRTNIKVVGRPIPAVALCQKMRISIAELQSLHDSGAKLHNILQSRGWK